MRHNCHLLLLPIALLLAIVVLSCSGLTDEEKKFVGTWSCESVIDTTFEESGIRMIVTDYDVFDYHEDKTYDQTADALCKMEFDFEDNTFRLYSYTHTVYKSAWSADNMVYTDSTINSHTKELVSLNNVVAVKDKRTGKVTRYSLFDKKFSDAYVPEVVNGLREIYKEWEKEMDKQDHERNLEKILSISDNNILIEDKDGIKYNMQKGKVMSPHVQQMIAEGEALR